MEKRGPHKVILFNPRSAEYNHRIPNSILQVAASIHDKFEYVFVDGNREDDAWNVINEYLSSGEFRYFGTTVMPGPQLQQAIPYAKMAKEQCPDLINIWGGYFASNQYQAVIKSPYIDYIVNGPGDEAFPLLLTQLEARQNDFSRVPNLIFHDSSGRVVKSPKNQLLDQDRLRPLPYDRLNDIYSIEGYLATTFLGRRTLAYHSSQGCPFKCSFCAVVPIYEARWKGKSAGKIYADIKIIKDRFGADSIEFHDNNFFVSEERTVEFARLIQPDGMQWWGEGRIDTVDRYSDASLAEMRASGCRMIFFGAESGNDDILKQMDKGGKQSAKQIKKFAARMQRFDIIPEYSFVLGMPAENEAKVMSQIDADIAFIKRIKEINPDTEIIIYIYSPVPTEGSALYKQISKAGFSFPEHLEDWLSPDWLRFDLRKNPLTPWLTPEMVDKIRDFETVLNAYYPTVSDFKLSRFQRRTMRLLSSMRYKRGIYRYPYELKALQKYWLKYRQPEIEGFYSEKAS